MTRRKPIHSAGYSLIELMVATLLGLLLLAGVLQVFINSKQGYQVQASVSRLQENARFASEYMSRYISLADLWDGVEASQVTVASGLNYPGGTAGSCVNSWVLNPADGIHGYAGAASSTAVGDPPGTCMSGTYVANSDLLAIRYVDPDSYLSTTAFPTSSPTLPDYWVRSKIGSAGQIFSGASNNSTITGDWDAVPGVLNYPFRAMLFYLTTIDNGAGLTPTLMVLMSQATSTGPQMVQQSLVDGVEMLRFQYGIDTNGDLSVDQYVDAGSVSNWAQVLSVRVSMVVRGDTLDNFVDTQSYQLTPTFCYGPASSACGAKYNYVTGAEKFQRRLVIREIQLRNRVRQ